MKDSCLLQTEAFAWENLCLFAFQDDECVRPGDASDLTFLEKLEEKMGNHPHFVT